jgi:hypothetical protein
LALQGAVPSGQPTSDLSEPETAGVEPVSAFDCRPLVSVPGYKRDTFSNMPPGL